MAALCLAGGFAYFATISDTRLPLSRGTAASKTEDASARELKDMRARMDRMQSEIQNARLAPTPPPAARTGREEHPAPARSSSPEEQKLRIAQTRTSHEHRFGTEAQSVSEWAESTQRGLEASVAELGPAAMDQVKSLKCRGNMCRMETEHANDIEALQFLDNLELRPGLNGARFARIRTESGGNSFVYFVEPQPTSSTIVSN